MAGAVGGKEAPGVRRMAQGTRLKAFGMTTEKSFFE
jgi:hypothetical protein